MNIEIKNKDFTVNTAYGAYGPQGIKLVKQIGKKIQDATGEKLSTFYLFQLISKCLFGVFNSPKKRMKTIQFEVP